MIFRACLKDQNPTVSESRHQTDKRPITDKLKTDSKPTPADTIPIGTDFFGLWSVKGGSGDACD